MDKQVKLLIGILVCLACLFYLGGIVVAGIASIMTDTKPQLPEVVTYAITMIGGVLATNFGAIVGFTALRNGGPRAKSLSLIFRTNSQSPRTMTDKIQVYGAWFYVLCLILASIFWGFDRFSEQSADVIRNMMFTLVGVAAGALTVAFGVKTG